jgi:hypothetical protein
MILDLISTLLAGILGAVISILPSDTWTPDVSGVTTVIGYVKGLNSVFPIDVVVTLFALAVAYSQFSLLFDVGVWVYHRLPFIGR